MRLWLLLLCLPFAQAQEVGRLLMLSFAGTEPPLARLTELRPAGFIFFADNFRSLEETQATTRRLRAAAPYPLLFGVDQEGGTVSRFRGGGATLFPGNAALGAAGDPVLAFRVGAAVGRELAYAGFNLNLAPVVDVATPDNPVVGERSFGPDPAVVAELGAAFAAGLERAGVAAVAKHFPGHGGADADSHLTLPVVARSRAGLARLELPPFKALVAAGVPAVMSAHVVFPALDDAPATLSRPVLTGLLRGKLGFDGVVVTDALNMRAITDRYPPGEAAVRSVRAGADLLLLVGGEAVQNEVYRALREALRSGRLSEARVREAISRTARLARRYPVEDAPRPDYAAHRALARVVALRGGVLRGAGALSLPSPVRVGRRY